jgi:hypothetical protein
MITIDTWKRGLQAGLKTSWILGKVVFPVTVIVGILKYTPVIDWIVTIFTPLMSIIGLPGEAAIPLTLSFFVGLYAGIGAILSLTLEVKEVFILAIMMSFAHHLLVETAVTKKMGVPSWISVSIRLGLAVSSAFGIHHLWDGGKEIAQYGLVASNEEAFQSWGWAVQQAVINAGIGMLQLVIVILPVMIAIQLCKEGNVLNSLSAMMRPFTRMLGLPENTSIPLMAGMFFGLMLGAGVLIQAAEEENYSKRDLLLLVIFLAACHAIVEDTLIFIPLGIPVVYLLLIRFTVALIATIVVAKILGKFSQRHRLQKGVQA